MTPNRPGCTRGAFTVVELLVVVAIVALLLSLLLPGLGQSRRAARAVICVSYLQQHGVATGSYAADFSDRIWAFSWKKGATPSLYPDLQVAAGDVSAAANQAVDILRNRADRPDMPHISNWIPHVRYSGLVLMDYLAARLPERIMACPEDRPLRLWQTSPRDFDKGVFPPQPWTGASSEKRHPYASSYQVPPCTFEQAAVPLRLSQALIACDGYYTPQDGKLGTRSMSMVHFPSQKAHMYDRHGRHSGRANPFFGLQACRQPILAFDGGVAARATSDTNAGWQPNDPASPEPSVVRYYPTLWDPGTVSGSEFDEGAGHYRWTRGGLAGLDWGGREIDTGQIP